MTDGERVVLRDVCGLFRVGEAFAALEVYPSHRDHARRRALERLADAGLIARAGDGYRLTLHSFDASGMPPPRRAG